MAAFAIYSEDDKSLKFYKRDTVPAVGDIFNELTVSKLYTETFETTTYTNSKHPNWQKDGTNKSVLSVEFVDVIKPKTLCGWFRDGYLIESFDLKKLDTSDCTAMGYLFRDCYVIKELDVSHFNTSKVTNMRSMFYNLSNLEELDVSNFDTGKVTDMCFLFYNLLGCNIIGVSGWNTSSCTQIQSMFYKCMNIKDLDLSGWDTSKITNMSYTFTGCAGNLNIVGWDTSVVTTMVAMFASSYFTYLDLSTFNLQSVTSCNSMFFNNTVIKTILVSHEWKDVISSTVDSYWMFENCYSLMGDVAYLDIVDQNLPIEDTYLLMTADYATTVGGYLTLKESEPEGGEGSEDEGENYYKTYMVKGNTLSDIASVIRNIMGTPSKIALKNFKRILQKQIGSAESSSVMFKDMLYINDDVSDVGKMCYIDTNFSNYTKSLNRFIVVPTVLKGSIITFVDLITLQNNLDAEIICEGDAEKVDNYSFLVNGDCTIKIVKKSEQPTMFRMIRKTASEQNHQGGGSDSNSD